MTGAVRRAQCAAAAAGAAAVLLISVTDARATRDRPPAGHTGGFGEPTCHACHLMDPPDSGPGRLALSGLPDPYAPGERYELTVELTHAGLAAAGFQLAVRFEDGGQAGTLAPAGAEHGRVDVSTRNGVTYAHQLDAGSDPTADGRARWTVIWTAPESPGSVRFHAAANAGDADLSPLGDFVYTTSASLASR